jgi:hypothetical protein
MQSFVVRTASNVTTTPGVASAEVFCQPGEVATGGGGETPIPGVGPGAVALNPLPSTAGATPTGWQARQVVGGTDQVVTTVWVVCASPWP